MSDAFAPDNTTPAGDSAPAAAEPSAPPAAVIPEPAPDIISTPPLPAPETSSQPAVAPDPIPAPPPPAPDVTTPPTPQPSSSSSAPELVEDDAVAARLGQLESVMGDILHALKVSSTSTPASIPTPAPATESTHPTPVVPEEGLSTPKVGQLVSYSYHDNVDGDVTLMGLVVATPDDPADTCRVAWLGQLSGPLPAAHLTALD